MPGSLCSILLLDDARTHVASGIGPSLAPSYLQAFNGVAIGPGVGSCGAAAYEKQPVFVEDIATHPNWVPFRELAATHGLAACWSQPVLMRDGSVAGTFAVYLTSRAGIRP